MRVLITGAGGMVGKAVVAVCKSAGDQVLAYAHTDLDIANTDQVANELAHERPEIVINCAAWTDVDGCQSDVQRAMNANSLGPENLARASRNVNAAFVTISTDYVFDGRKQGFYTQRDDPNPESVYGVSKLEGERKVQAAYARSIVVRSGYIFGFGGRNFLSTILERAQRGEKLIAITDMWGTPTYAPDLASRLRELAMRDLPGIYHPVNAGEGATFEQFVWRVLSEADLTNVEVATVSADELSRPAPRPRNSRLRCLLSEAIGLDPLRSWQEAVTTFAQSQRKVETAVTD